MRAKLVVRISADMMEFIHRDQSVVKGLNPDLSTANRKVGGYRQAPDHAVRKDFTELTLPPSSGGVAQVPFWRHHPVSPETELSQRFIIETGPDGFFWHNDNGLFQP